MLKHRVLTAAIGLPFLIGIIVLGPAWSVITFFAAVAGICSYELASMFIPRLAERLQSGQGEQRLTILLTALVGVCIFVANAIFPASQGRGFVVFAILIGLAGFHFTAKTIENAMVQILGFLLVIAYASLPWLCLWDLYLTQTHGRLVIFSLSIVWAGDTGAYFAGRFFGKTKLAPKISPKKTVEGATGGLVCSLFTAYVCAVTFLPDTWDIRWILLIGGLGAIAGQAGDLMESSIKRFSQVKDSGGILPGHGGILDRADGLLLSMPVVWFLINVLLT